MHILQQKQGPVLRQVRIPTENPTTGIPIGKLDNRFYYEITAIERTIDKRAI